MKTGYTDGAGKCLIAGGTRPGKDVIVVVLGDSSRWGVARCVRATFVGAFVVKSRRRDRTRDLRFTKPLLYQLSYVGICPLKGPFLL